MKKLHSASGPNIVAITAPKTVTFQDFVFVGRARFDSLWSDSASIGQRYGPGRLPKPSCGRITAHSEVAHARIALFVLGLTFIERA
jgi:hypothetical protein